MKTGQTENCCKPSTSKAAIQNRDRKWLAYSGTNSDELDPARWWDSGRYGQVLMVLNPETGLSECIPAPENKTRWSDVMERLRDRRDLKKMREKTRKEKRGR